MSVALVAGLVSLTIYGSTLAPGLSWAHHGADGGDLITAAMEGRVPHPPGFPVYMALADIFVRIPLRTPAWRLNMLSACMAALTVALVAYIIQQAFNSPWVSLAAALSLACAPLFWSQALITEVYTTTALFSTLSLFILSVWAGTSRFGWFMAGLAWGLGIATHLTLSFSAPLWVAEAKARGETRAGWKTPLTFGGLGVVCGLLPYILLPLRGPWPQPWGDMRTLVGWWDLVSARIYHGFAFGLPWNAWPQRILAWGALMTRQFTPVGALLILAGGCIVWKQSRAYVIGIVIPVLLASLYALGYNTPDSVVYFVPWLPWLAVCLGHGLAAASAQGLPRYLGMLLPLALVIWNWGAMDISVDGLQQASPPSLSTPSARAWLTRTLAETPSEAVLVTAQDRHTFALWYAQSGLGLRPDVTVVDRDLWAEQAYREFLGATTLDLEDWARGEQPSRPFCQALAEEVRCR